MRVSEWVGHASGLLGIGAVALLMGGAALTMALAA